MEKKFTDKYEILTSNGFKDFSGVGKTTKESLKIIFNDSSEIICSYDHKFYENGRFIKAKDLHVNDILSKKIIISIEDNGTQELYDILEVEDGHHFTVNGWLESSNCAFIPKNLWEKFYTSTFPTISSGKDSQLIMVSTPNGQNHFYDFWIKAIEGKSNMYPTEVNWWDVPGRDENWHKEMLLNMSEEQFTVEYGNSFTATSNTLIAPVHFSKLEKNLIDPIQSSDNIKIYNLPEKGHSYFATVDCASVGIDFSTVSIIDITSFPYKQVAVFADDKISHLSFPQIIVNLAVKYNSAEVLVESNEIGNTILHILNYDLEYENIVKTYIGERTLPLLGQRTTVKSKSVGCARLKDMVESNGIIIQDKSTLVELRHFCIHKSSYAAETGYHDDLIMGIVNFAYYASTKQFRSKYDENFTDKYRESHDIELLESLSPIPLFSGNNWGEGMSKEDYRWLE